MKPIARLIAAGLGTGYAPRAPGTAGSLLGLGIGAALLHTSPAWLALFTALAILLGTACIPLATAIPLRATSAAAHQDPSWIVIDEIAGQCIALLALPRISLAGLALAFAAFRFFDILKPGPVGWADRQGGAIGIMLDDVFAGVAAAGCVYVAEISLRKYVLF